MPVTSAARGEQYDVVILDPAKMTRDRDQVIPALKKYLDMNKLALGVAAPGALFATFSCTGLVSEDEFLGMLRRAAFYGGREVQVLKIAGAGADHPFLVHAAQRHRGTQPKFMAQPPLILKKPFPLNGIPGKCFPVERAIAEALY